MDELESPKEICRTQIGSPFWCRPRWRSLTKPPFWTEHQKQLPEASGKQTEQTSWEGRQNCRVVRLLVFSPFHPWLEPEDGPIRELCRGFPLPQVKKLLILARRPGKGGPLQAGDYGSNLFFFRFFFFVSSLSLTPRVASL